MEENTLSRSFVERVVPTLSPEDQAGFFSYTNEVANQSKQKALTPDAGLTAQRKQSIVNKIYNNGMPTGGQQ